MSKAHARKEAVKNVLRHRVSLRPYWLKNISKVTFLIDFPIEIAVSILLLPEASPPFWSSWLRVSAPTISSLLLSIPAPMHSSQRLILLNCGSDHITLRALGLKEPQRQLLGELRNLFWRIPSIGFSNIFFSRWIRVSYFTRQLGLFLASFKCWKVPSFWGTDCLLLPSTQPEIGLSLNDHLSTKIRMSVFPSQFSSPGIPNSFLVLWAPLCLRPPQFLTQYTFSTCLLHGLITNGSNALSEQYYSGSSFITCKGKLQYISSIW